MRDTVGNRVRVELTGADGALVAGYDAAVARHEDDGEVVHWHVLVADSLIIELQLRTENENLVSSPLQFTFAGTANGTQLAACTFLLEMQQARTLAFLVRGEVFLQGQVEEQPPEVLGQLRGNVELLEDVVGVEECSGQEIEPFTRSPVGALSVAVPRIRSDRLIDPLRTVPARARRSRRRFSPAVPSGTAKVLGLARLGWSWSPGGLVRPEEAVGEHGRELKAVLFGEVVGVGGDPAGSGKRSPKWFGHGRDSVDDHLDAAGAAIAFSAPVGLLAFGSQGASGAGPRYSMR